MIVRMRKTRTTLNGGYTPHDLGVGIRVTWYRHVHAILVQIGPFWAQLSNYETIYEEY